MYFMSLDLPKALFSVKQLDKASGEIRIKYGQLTLVNKFGHTIANCPLNLDLDELGTTIISNKEALAIPTTTHVNKIDL